MLNVGKLNEGVVLDHIKAGKSMSIYRDLHLDEIENCVAIIKNARSGKMGKKDIIKIEASIDKVDLDILGGEDEEQAYLFSHIPFSFYLKYNNLSYEYILLR